VLSVGATDDHSRPWKKTQVSDYVAVAAPGVNTSTIGRYPGVYYPDASGTSDSAALVSGAAALVRSANPAMPAREVVHRLIATALDVNTPGWDNRSGYGIVRINRALKTTSFAVAPDSPNPPYERFDRWRNPAYEPPSPAASAGRSESPAAPPDAGKRGSGSAPIVWELAGIVVIAGVVWLAVAVARRRESAGPGRPAASTPDGAAGSNGAAGSDGAAGAAAPSPVPVEPGSSAEGG
jgi:membrane-anchored mycosin MYCP